LLRRYRSLQQNIEANQKRKAKMKYERIKIDKDVPLPVKMTCNKYPLREMEVGDSFLHPLPYSREAMTKISNSVRGWGYLQKPQIKFALRKTRDNNIRIWRIE